MIVRDARPGELAEVGEIRVAAYLADGFLTPDSGYAPTLQALGLDGDGAVLVAVAREDDCRILGTVMLQPWPHAGQTVAGPDEAEIRALAVLPEARGRGTGSALLRAVIERAAQQGVRHLVLVTLPEMVAAQRLYRRAGFRRLPDRDWSPVPGMTLLAYGLALTGGGQAGPADDLGQAAPTTARVRAPRADLAGSPTPRPGLQGPGPSRPRPQPSRCGVRPR